MRTKISHRNSLLRQCVRYQIFKVRIQPFLLQKIEVKLCFLRVCFGSEGETVAGKLEEEDG